MQNPKFTKSWMIHIEYEFCRTWVIAQSACYKTDYITKPDYKTEWS